VEVDVAAYVPASVVAVVQAPFRSLSIELEDLSEAGVFLRAGCQWPPLARWPFLVVS